MAAELRNLIALNLAMKTGSLTHGVHVCFGGVATVTTGAGQPFLSMNILRELGLSYLQRRIQSGMAIQACARGLGVGRAGTNAGNRQQKNERSGETVI